MSIAWTVFWPQTVDPSSGRAVMFYTDVAGTPGSPSGPLGWTADDGGAVVTLSEYGDRLEIEPVAAGTSTLTATGEENGQVVTATVVAVVTSVAGRFEVTVEAGNSSIRLQAIDGGTPTAPGLGAYDGGSPTSIYTVTISGGAP